MLCHADCSPRREQLFSSPRCRQTLAEPLAQVGAFSISQLGCLSHVPRASQATSFQGIISLLSFLKVSGPCFCISFFFPPSVLFSVQHHHYFTWLAVDNFSLWNSLSFKFNFLIVSWERNAASGLCFIIYILGGNKQRHGNSKDSFRDEVQANTWYMSSSY